MRIHLRMGSHRLANVLLAYLADFVFECLLINLPRQFLVS